MFSHLSEIFIIRKQQAFFEELFFRVLELQNFSMSEIVAIIFSWANTNQVKYWKLQYSQRYFFEFCIHWECDICGQVKFYILSANQECHLLYLLADRVSKFSRGSLQVIVLNAFAPCPLPHRFSFCTVVSLTLQTIKEKAACKACSFFWCTLQAARLVQLQIQFFLFLVGIFKVFVKYLVCKWCTTQSYVVPNR